MTEQQIKDYLEKYRIKSAPQLADHIGELKRNTTPNVALISELVYILEDDSSFFFHTKEPEKLQKTINNHILEIMSKAFFLDEAIEASNKNTNSTRHKSINGETHKELTTEKKLKIAEGFKKEALKQQLDAILENIEIQSSQSSYISPKKKEEIKTDWIDFVANGMKRGKIIKYENLAENTEKEDAMVNKRDKKIGHSTFEKDNGIKESQSVEKAPIFTYCKVNKNALEELSLRALYGHKKYEKGDDWENFSRVPNGDFEYANAQFRHALEIGGEEDEKAHLISSAWNAISRLEIYLRKNNL